MEKVLARYRCNPDEAFHKMGFYNHEEMAARIADLEHELREALAAACSQGLPGSEAPATRVTTTDRWALVGVNGLHPNPNVYHTHEIAKSWASYFDKEIPEDAPHRVVRVALVEEDSHQSVPSDHATRVTDEMVERAIRVGRDYGYFDWDESGEERVAGMRAVLTAALAGGDA